MELKDMPLAVVAIVLIGIVIGVGVIILDQFGVATKVSVSVVNETAVTISSGTGSLANDDVTAFTYFGNNTNSTDDPVTDINIEVNWTTAGVITVAPDYLADGTYNASYLYDADSASTTATFSARDAVDDFVVWIPVIIIIIASAIILGLVMKSFRQ